MFSTTTKKVKIFLLILIFSLLSFVAGYFSNFYIKRAENITIVPVKEKPLLKYTVDNLSKYDFPSSRIEIGQSIDDNDRYTSSLFRFTFNPSLDDNNQKTITGLINIPRRNNLNQKYPIILMLRGYVDQKIYQTGMGTQRAGEYFAQNGFITVAPDFLGYGGSNTESGNILESRFQTYVTALSLLKSFGSLDLWDGNNIFIWGHSNGGQIALTVLEISGAAYPTALWAPVSKPFPYSILYYTDESEDRGKLIRKELAKFEEDYNTDDYSFDNFLDRIKAPVQIHQGTNDDAVPADWTRELCAKLKNLDLDLNCYLYSGADHNLQPSWNRVVERDLEFFNKNLQN